MSPLRTARMTRPNTSSTTAAPRMTRASGVAPLPRSRSTRAVMPTLVAVSVAPRKACAYGPSPGRSSAPTHHPSAKGAMTPSVATRSAVAPTFNMSRTVDSRPTSNNRMMTPTCARASSVGLVASPCSPVIPIRPRLPSSTPATSSPSTAGCRARVARSPPSFAAARMIASPPRIVGMATKLAQRRRDPQRLADRPRLKWAPARRERRLGVRDLRDVSQSRLIETENQRVEKATARCSPRCGRVTVHPQPRIDERSEEPGPGGALVIGGVAGGLVSRIARMIVGIVGGERAQPERREELLLDDCDDARGPLSLEQCQQEPAHGEDLVGAHPGVARAALVVDVDHVVETPTLGIPEPFRKRAAPALARLAPPLVGRRPDGERVEPQGLDFHRLADARRDHPVADLDVHPRQRHTRRSRGEQPIAVEPDTVARATGVRGEDGLHRV